MKVIHNAGKSNDELGHHLLPLEMFRFLDGEQCNPDFYQVKTYQGNFHQRFYFVYYLIIIWKMIISELK